MKKRKFMKKWDKLADKKTIENTVAALKANGIDAQVVENGKAAKVKVLEPPRDAINIGNL